MRVYARGLGQATATVPKVVQFARNNATPFPAGEDFSTMAKRIAVSKTDSILLRVGSATSNKLPYFAPFQGNQVYVWVFEFVGPRAGVAYSIPLNDLVSKYSLVNDSAREAIYQVSPLPSMTSFPFGWDTILDDVEEGFNRSNEAMEAATTFTSIYPEGNLQAAETLLGESNLGAQARLERAAMAARALWALDQIKDEDYQYFLDSTLKGLRESVAKARKLVDEGKIKGSKNILDGVKIAYGEAFGLEKPVGKFFGDVTDLSIDQLTAVHLALTVSNQDIEDFIAKYKPELGGTPEGGQIFADLEKNLAQGKELEAKIQKIEDDTLGAPVSGFGGLGQSVIKKFFIKALMGTWRIFAAQSLRRAGKAGVMGRVSREEIGEVFKALKKTAAAEKMSIPGALAGDILRITGKSIWNFLFGSWGSALKTGIAFAGGSVILERIINADRAGMMIQKDYLENPNLTKKPLDISRSNDIAAAAKDLADTYGGMSGPFSDPIIESKREAVKAMKKQYADGHLAAFGESLKTGETNIWPYVIGGTALAGLGLYFYLSSRKEEGV